MNPRVKNSSGTARLLVLSVSEVTVWHRRPLGTPRQSGNGRERCGPGPARSHRLGAGTPGPWPSPFVPLFRTREAAGSGAIHPGQPEVRLTCPHGAATAPIPGQGGAGGAGGMARAEGHRGQPPPPCGHHHARWCPLWFISAPLHSSAINLPAPSLRWLLINLIQQRAASTCLATCTTYFNPLCSCDMEGSSFLPEIGAAPGRILSCGVIFMPRHVIFLDVFFFSLKSPDLSSLWTTGSLLL